MHIVKFGESFSPIFKKGYRPVVFYPAGAFYFRHFPLSENGKRSGGGIPDGKCAAIGQLWLRAVESGRIGIKPVITKLIIGPQQQQDTHHETYRQTRNIDHGIHLALAEIAQGYFEIVFEHGNGIILYDTCQSRKGYSSSSTMILQLPVALTSI